MLLSACGFSGGNTSDDKNTLVLTDKGEPPNLDTALSTDQVSFTVLTNAMEGLMRLGKDHKPAPGIAQSYDVSADKLTYTFHLRDAKWSDGKPVTAHDFEFAWKRALDPKTASQYAYIMEPIKNAMEYNSGKAKASDVGVKALDDKTLQVTLKAPTPYFLNLMTFCTFLPQRQDVVEKFGKKYALEASNMVYDGPFVITKWNHGQDILLAKNKNYWDSSVVKLQKVDIKFLTDESTRVNLYETGKIDYTEITKDFADKFKNSPDKFVIKESSAWYIEFNQIKGLFKNNPKLRQAIELAIDKKALASEILKNGSIPAGSVVPPDIQGTGNQTFRQMSPDNPQYDPAKAKQLWQAGLKQAGIKNPGTIDLMGDNTDNAQTQMEFIANELKQNLGINVTTSPVTFKERLQRSKDANFQMVLSGWGADYNDPITYLNIFTTGQSYNDGKWSNKQYDALIQKSTNNPNFTQRMNDLIQAEKILVNDQGIAPLYFRTRLGLVKSYVKGWVWDPTYGFYDLKYAYLDGKK